MPLIVEGHPAFLADSDSRSIGDYPHLRCARAVEGEAVRSPREELPGRPLVAVRERQAFGSWTITRLRPMVRGKREERGKSSRREIQVLTTLGIVDFEYGDCAQVYVLSEVFDRRQQAVDEEAPHGPRFEFALREPDSTPLIVGGHPAFLADPGSRSIRYYPNVSLRSCGRRW
jgi:hypothetical protein